MSGSQAADDEWQKELGTRDEGLQNNIGSPLGIWEDFHQGWVSTSVQEGVGHPGADTQNVGHSHALGEEQANKEDQVEDDPQLHEWLSAELVRQDT